MDEEGPFLDSEFLNTLFQHLPNLTFLDCFGLTDLVQWEGATIKLPLSLRSVKTDLALHHGTFNLRDLAFLERLPQLIDLRLFGWSFIDIPKGQASSLLSLPMLENLQVHGVGTLRESVSRITAACPRLRRLELHEDGNNMHMSDALRHHPNSLETLVLAIYMAPVSLRGQEELARFTQLRSLDLGDECYDQKIHTTLQHLPLLSRLRLGFGKIDPVGFESLISGPSRLRSLRHLTLDLLHHDLHDRKRITRPSGEGFSASSELYRCPMSMKDWKECWEKRREMGPLRLKELKDMIGRAKTNGVVIEGTVVSLIQALEEYDLEANNRRVINIYDQQSILLKTRRALTAAGDLLPPIDSFEIVETDSPNRNWFVLSFRNTGELE